MLFKEVKMMSLFFSHKPQEFRAGRDIRGHLIGPPRRGGAHVLWVHDTESEMTVGQPLDMSK